MKKLTFKIQHLKLLAVATFTVLLSVMVNGKEINRVNGLKIRNSWREITDTATITLPLLASKNGNGEVAKSMADKFKPGDAVEIKCGYIGMYDTYERVEFKGFVKKINPTVPLTVECEDGSYWFRKVSVYKEWKKADNATLESILTYLVAEVNKESKQKFQLVKDLIPEFKLTTFRIGNNDSKVNAAEALQFLKDEYGLAIWFDDDKLLCRMAYTDVAGRKDVKINLQGNVIKGGNRLTFRDNEEVQYVVNGKAILPDNKVIEAKYPANGKGDNRPYVTLTAKDKATLELLIKAYHAKLGANARIEGYVTTKLIPFANHSDTLIITDPEFKQREGKYLCDTVELEYTARGGFVRKIYPGIKLS